MLNINVKRSWDAFKWTVIREYWEHKRTIGYLPLVFAGLIVLAALYAAVKTPNLEFLSSDGIEFNIGHTEQISWMQAEEVPVTPELKQRFQEYEFVDEELKVSDYGRNELVDNVGYLLPMVFLGLGVIIAATYLLSTLFLDRKNSTILFWKSLPVSEYGNVAIKFGVGVALIPLLYLVVSWGALLIVKVMFWGVSLGAESHSKVALWGQQIDMLAAIVESLWVWVQCVIWSSPLAMLCLLICALSKRSPFIHLVVIVGGVAFLEFFLFENTFLVGWFIAHNPFEVLSGDIMLSQSWANATLGVAIAVAMYFPTVWLRNHRFET